MTGVHQRRAQAPEGQSSERRINKRYAVKLDMSYSVLGCNPRDETGTSQAIDLSSSGLRFLAERPLAPGLQVDVVINWPALLDGRIPLQLITTGVVVRTSGRRRR